MEGYTNLEENPIERETSFHKKRACLMVSFILGIIFYILLIVILSFIILVVYLTLGPEEIQPLNIHVNVEGTCKVQAQQLNEIVVEAAAGNEINFNETHIPHMTLYLTLFNMKYKDKIIETVQKEVQYWSSKTKCEVTLKNGTIKEGTYALWDQEGETPNCLQQMSDRIVQATSKYISHTAKETIPEWVEKIKDERIRKLKKDMIHQYGSPNVYKMFDPHVTLAYDPENTSKFKEIISKIETKQCQFKVKGISIGNVGKGGSVLKDGELDYIIP